MVARLAFLTASSLLVATNGIVTRTTLLVATSQTTAMTKDGQRVVTQIVNLLKQMLKDVEKDRDLDARTNEKFECWCAANAIEKTEAVKQLEADIQNYKDIQVAKQALSEQLTLQLEQLAKDIEDLQLEMEHAEKQREIQREKHHQSVLELEKAVGSINSAIVVLQSNLGLITVGTSMNKHLPKAEAQKQKRALAKVESTVKQMLLSKSVVNLSASVSGSLQKLDSIMQKQTPGEASSTVIGILTQMQTTMAEELEETKKNEAEAKTLHEEMRVSKSRESELARKSRAAKEESQTQAKLDAAQAQQDQADAEKTMEELDGWIEQARQTCDAAKAEYETRVANRSEEMKAISKAIDILGSDDARDMFAKVHDKNMFLQLSSRSNSKLNFSSDISNAIKLATQKLESTGEVELAALTQYMKAAGARLNALAKSGRQDPAATTTDASHVTPALQKLISKIAGLVADLKTAQKNEVQEKAMCQTMMAEQEKADVDQTHLVETINTDITLLEENISSLTEKSHTALKEAEDLADQYQQAGEDYAEEKAELDEQVSEQVAVQGVLTQGIRVLEEHYKGVTAPEDLDVSSLNQEEDPTEAPAAAEPETVTTTSTPPPMPSDSFGPGFLQKKSFSAGKEVIRSGVRRQPAGTNPIIGTAAPETFVTSGGDHSASGSVIAMIDGVRMEAKRMEGELRKALDAALKEHTEIQEKTMQMITAIQAQIAQFETQKAEKESAKSTKEEELKAEKDTHLTLIEQMDALRGYCLPLLNAFDENQMKRTHEMEALNEATAILQGADIRSEFANMALVSENVSGFAK